MKAKALLLFILLPLSAAAQSKQTASSSTCSCPTHYGVNQNIKSNIEQSNDTTVYSIVETNPAFPGGNAELMRFIKENLRYPDELGETDVQGRVSVEFVVETDGSITNAKVVRSLHPALDKEALRIIKSMPKWTPGINKGIKVRTRYRLPVTFRLT